jgi:hypothetical protein
MPQRRFPPPWRFELVPGGYRVIDANGLALDHVYGEPPNAIAISDKRLSGDEAEKIARLIVRLPGLVELERDRSRPRSRRKPQPLRCKPVTIGDLINAVTARGPLQLVPPGASSLYRCRQSHLPKRLPVPEVANNLICSICGARNSDTYHPIWARPVARVPGVTGHYPDFNKR